MQSRYAARYAGSVDLPVTMPSICAFESLVTASPVAFVDSWPLPCGRGAVRASASSVPSRCAYLTLAAASALHWAKFAGMAR